MLGRHHEHCTEHSPVISVLESCLSTAFFESNFTTVMLIYSVFSSMMARGKRPMDRTKMLFIFTSSRAIGVKSTFTWSNSPLAIILPDPFSYEGSEICIKVHFGGSSYKLLLRSCPPWVPRSRLTLVHGVQPHLMCDLNRCTPYALWDDTCSSQMS